MPVSETGRLDSAVDAQTIEIDAGIALHSIDNFTLRDERGYLVGNPVSCQTMAL